MWNFIWSYRKAASHRQFCLLLTEEHWNVNWTLTWVAMLLGDRPTLFLDGYFTGETHMSGMCVLQCFTHTEGDCLWPHAPSSVIPKQWLKCTSVRLLVIQSPRWLLERKLVLQVKVPSKVGQLTHKGVLITATLDSSLKVNLNAQKQPSYAISSLSGLGNVTSLLSACSVIGPKLII